MNLIGIALWLNRDPIEELGGIYLYCFLFNRPVGFVDKLGLDHAACVNAALDKLRSCLNNINNIIDFYYGGGVATLCTRKLNPIGLGLDFILVLTKMEAQCYGTFSGDISACPPDPPDKCPKPSPGPEPEPLPLPPCF
jgi:hypothetical protein